MLAPEDGTTLDYSAGGTGSGQPIAVATRSALQIVYLPVPTWWPRPAGLTINHPVRGRPDGGYESPGGASGGAVQVAPGGQGALHGFREAWVGARAATAALLGLFALLAAGPAWAQCVGNVCTVANATDLVSALTTIDNTPGTYTINITANIVLGTGTTLPAITGSANNVTINGGGFTLDGGSVQRGFFVYQGTVAINNLTIQNTTATGGTGGAIGGGGGGAGLGGALFVANTATVSVSNVVPEQQ
jgi:hypothetical protein